MKRWITWGTIFAIALLAMILVAPYIYAEAGKFAGLTKPAPGLPRDVSPKPISTVPVSGPTANPHVTPPAGNVSVAGASTGADLVEAATGNASLIETVPPGSPVTLLEAPGWVVGDWWIVRESIRNDVVAVADPPWSAPIDWRMTVVGIEQYTGEPCFVINATSEGGQGAWGQAYYNVSHLALRKAEFHYSPSADIIGGASATDIMSTTGDISLFIIPGFPSYMTEQLSEMPSVPGDNGTPDNSAWSHGSPEARCYKVNVMSHGFVAAWELWHPGAPWWLYLDRGSLRARLIDCSWWHGQS